MTELSINGLKVEAEKEGANSREKFLLSQNPEKVDELQNIEIEDAVVTINEVISFLQAKLSAGEDIINAMQELEEKNTSEKLEEAKDKLPDQ